jgi:hypothetical protein
MKTTLLHIVGVLSFALFSTGVDAQIIGPGPGGACSGTVDIQNGSGDGWTVSYYNNNIFVPAGTQVTLGFVNADPTIGRGVILGPLPATLNACAYKFQNNPDLWNPPCAPNTFQVTYNAVQNPANGCFTSGLIRIQ